MKFSIKKFITVGIISCLSLFSMNSFAKSEIATAYFSDDAVSGYDVVAYFTQGKPVEGREKFSVEYKDALWSFSSQEHLDLFNAEPEKYAPQYGGYCAWSVAQGNSAGADPLVWKIIDNKLYLNYDVEVQQMWLKDSANFIIQADKNWPKVIK